MVTIKRTNAGINISGSRRLLSSRLSQLDATSRLKSDLSLPATRRTDQRSTVSIAGSSRSGGQRIGAGNRCDARAAATAAAAIDGSVGSVAWPKGRRPIARGMARMCRSGVGTEGRRRTGDQTSSNSSSAGEPTPPHRTRATCPAVPGSAVDDMASGRKTVSISTSQCARTASVPLGPSDSTRRSIMKPRPMYNTNAETSDAHNNGLAAKAEKEQGQTPHQIRERNIFEECRFVPWDPFYKKVVIAPNQDRRFFTAPKSFRGPGNHGLYDIANQNPGHHRDVNVDFTRDSIKRFASNYCRPSNFRHFNN